MKRIIFSCIFIGGLLAADTAIALVTKSTGQISYRKFSETEMTDQLPRGTELYNDDLIQTGQDGFAKYVYLDDGSTVKITADAEIYVRGSVKGSAINKRVNVSDGALKFEVQNQKSNEFTIITPTSVASVKGTRFWLDCKGEAGDHFFGLEGLVDIQNNRSRQNIQLEKNTTVTSLPSGELTAAPTKPEEMQNLRDIDDETGDSDTDDTETNEIRIQMENADGTVKELNIKYK